MNKNDLAKQIARRKHVDAAGAADQIDRAVTRIVRTLRGGRPAHLPGLGIIQPGKPWRLEPERDDH